MDSKNTKELLVAFLSISALLAEKFKDGVQFADFAEIAGKIAADEELKAKIEAAYKDIELVGGEVKDLQLGEIVELITAAIPEVQKLIVALRK